MVDVVALRQPRPRPAGGREALDTKQIFRKFIAPLNASRLLAAVREANSLILQFHHHEEFHHFPPRITGIEPTSIRRVISPPMRNVTALFTTLPTPRSSAGPALRPHL